MSCSTDAFLQIETTLGGTWRYPIRLIATEPPPDDTIVIEAAGLNQESIVGFRLFSKSKYLYLGFLYRFINYIILII